MPTNKTFQIIPGIGKSLSKDLIDLGYQQVNELIDEDPEVMYQNLMILRGHPIDRCVYMFSDVLFITPLIRPTIRSY